MNVILYTGGLDSYIGLFLLNSTSKEKWQPLYFNLDIPYSHKELKVVRKVDGINIVSGLLNMRYIARQHDYIPQRNTLLCAAAQSVYGDTVERIALCSVADDVYADNSEQFHSQMTELLSLTTGHDVKVFSPLEDTEGLMSKREAAKDYLNKGGRPEALLNTVHCYHPTKIECGKCRACIRHAITMMQLGIRNGASD